jgi:hypothetical protein
LDTSLGLNPEWRHELLLFERKRRAEHTMTWL